MTNKPTIGFIGMGIMGLAMAKNTAAKGYPVVVTNRSKQRKEQAEKAGLAIVDTPQNVMDQSDAVIVMVTNSEAVEHVLSGKEGLFSGETNGKTLIQMSTIDEASTLKFAKQSEDHGLRFLDCPVAGSKKQVEAAELIILAGGEEDDLKVWDGVLKAMGKAVVHAGKVGKGTNLKLCMNLIVSQMTTALCESVALARVQNLDPQKIFDVIKQSPAINCGYFSIKEPALLYGDFSPAFSLENMLKDVRFMDQAAKDKRLALPVTQAVRFLMEAAVTEGLGNQDLSVISKILKSKIEQN